MGGRPALPVVRMCAALCGRFRDGRSVCRWGVERNGGCRGWAMDGGDVTVRTTTWPGCLIFRRWDRTYRYVIKRDDGFTQTLLMNC